MARLYPQESPGKFLTNHQGNSSLMYISVGGNVASYVHNAQSSATKVVVAHAKL